MSLAAFLIVLCFVGTSYGGPMAEIDHHDQGQDYQDAGNETEAIKPEPRTLRGGRSRDIDTDVLDYSECLRVPERLIQKPTPIRVRVTPVRRRNRRRENNRRRRGGRKGNDYEVKLNRDLTSLRA